VTNHLVRRHLSPPTRQGRRHASYAMENRVNFFPISEAFHNSSARASCWIRLQHRPGNTRSGQLPDSGFQLPITNYQSQLVQLPNSKLPNSQLPITQLQISLTLSSRAKQRIARRSREPALSGAEGDPALLHYRVILSEAKDPIPASTTTSSSGNSPRACHPERSRGTCFFELLCHSDRREESALSRRPPGTTEKERPFRAALRASV
jgi:hypothetical protein